LSSTTDAPSERGQILVVFAVALFVIFGIAALAFDAGLMMLEKRDQQNAADAASIAGARFLPGDQSAAEAEAYAVAELNGFEDGVGDQSVTVTFPDTVRIAVRIEDTTPSLFARIWGLVSHDVASRAVAINGTRPLGPFGILSLNETDCAAMDIGGGGTLTSNGDVQVNSTCSPRAWWLRGTGEIVVADGVACRVVGEFEQSGAHSEISCVPEEGAVAIPDPFLALDPYEPSIPRNSSGDIVYPDPITPVGSTSLTVPTGCPGSTAPATHEAPGLCTFTASYAGTTWRLYPGYYPGGIDLKGGTFYLEPGIYHLAGGGFNANGTGVSVVTVEAGGTTWGGGVLLFNSQHEDGAAADGNITLNGSSSGVLLRPLQSGTWAGMVIYQQEGLCDRVTINGNGATIEVRGTIYVPCGKVLVNGNGGTIITDQVVADTFEMTGASGSVIVAFDREFLPGIRLAGLIE
jgi:Putative Flp pilus-assembly TadE/G-like